MKVFALIALKIMISIGLIIWLLSRADLSQIWLTIQNAHAGFLLLAFLLFFIGYFLAAKRWQMLLGALGVPARWLMLVQSFTIAIFFNNFLPSTIGGDAYRMYDSYTLGAGKARAITVIFIDRVLGLSALLILAFVASIIAGDIAREIPLLRLFLGGALIGLIILAWIIFGHGGKFLLKISMGDNRLIRIIHKIINKVYSGFHLFQGRADVMLKAIGLSLFLQINVVIHSLIIAHALNIQIPIIAMFIIIPLAYLIMIAPISINGIGLRESVFVFFFGLYGVPQEQALAFAFISFGMILTQGVIGGIVFMLRRRSASATQATVVDPP